ncbi:oxidoreductase [Lutibacter sp. B1]|uniref:WD40/YVTN/BNR-like repeat-containing protein n=1 Tax=Lutibacter sp. B1 TaxID=2725996 RepID=UPI0014564991|nr:oxidoreductase [Lutibacter sp. B1]NLP58372.1 oxidoreductase [Lutibacter sp. B1]
MKKLIYSLFIIFLSFTVSCNKKYVPRQTITISLEKFKLDSTGIRAIEVLNDTSIMYAGSIGDIGILTNLGEEILKRTIKTDSVIPHFRALASTNKAHFILNVGNPALLYKLENDSITIVYKEMNEKVFYDSMQFFDELNGIAMGDPTEDCLSIILTHDGGNTWQKIPCNNLPKIQEGEAAFAASNTNIAIVGSNAWIATGGIKSRVFHTPDMGKTWEVFNTPIIQGKNTTGIYSVAFFYENQGIICGGDYTDKFGNYANKALTFDGGKTWKVVSENLPPKYVSCVQYIPNTQGNEVVAVSTNGIFFSNNKGKNWQKVSNESFYAIRFINENEAWLSGNEVIAKMYVE